MAALLHLARIRGETCSEFRGGIPVVEIHSGIAEEVGLGDEDLAAIVGRQGHRKECHPAIVPGRYRNHLVGILE